MHNPSAFPNAYEARSDGGRGEMRKYHVDGMTLRDYFAAKAMQSLLQVAAAEGLAEEPQNAMPISEASYFMADAMLAAREVGK